MLLEPFADRLAGAIRAKRNPTLVGLDPHLGRLPEEFAVARNPSAPRAERAAAVTRFLCQVIDVVAPHVAVVKPQSAFFEALGADGVASWEQVIAYARHSGLLVIGDVKRGDIGSTAQAYAQAFLGSGDAEDEAHLCDAITINPYLGSDSIDPFLETCRATGRGLYILVRTSNPSSAEFQAQGDPNLSEQVASAVHRWGQSVRGERWSSVGAVVGATHRDELAKLRRLMPDAPLLLPGYGAQGAGAEDVAPAFEDGLEGAIVNSSRGILFAGEKAPELDWRVATEQAVIAMAEDLRRVAAPC